MLKLTDHDSGDDLYINPRLIVSFIKNDKTTQIITTAQGWYEVKETPEEINKMINELFDVYL